MQFKNKYLIQSLAEIFTGLSQIGNIAKHRLRPLYYTLASIFIDFIQIIKQILDNLST